MVPDVQKYKGKLMTVEGVVNLKIIIFLKGDEMVRAKSDIHCHH